MRIVLVHYEIESKDQSILDEKDTLWFVKGNSPLSIIHFPNQKVYVYASTDEILYKNHKFGYILSAVPSGEMLGMSDTMHEADISKFVNALDERLKGFYTQTALTRFRAAADLSQSELAEQSGVSIRIIQAYEQRMRDINKAQLATIVKLAINYLELITRRSSVQIRPLHQKRAFGFSECSFLYALRFIEQIL